MRKYILLALMSLLSVGPASAYDFSELNDDGVEIYYNKFGSGTVSVTYAALPTAASYVPCYQGDIEIPARVTHDGVSYGVSLIGERAFQNCPDLTSAILPATIVQIKDNAFSGCTGLTSVNLPEGLAYIGENAFFECTSLTEMTVPETVESIGVMAFTHCYGMKSLTLKSQGKYTMGMNSCTGNGLNLRTVKVYNPDPENITMGLRVFNGTDFDKATLYVPQGTVEAYRQAPQWSDFKNIEEMDVYDFAEDGIYYRFNPTDPTTVSVSCKDYKCNSYSGSVIIPATVTHDGITYTVDAIGERAFYGCTSLASVRVPWTVHTFGDYAFGDCTGLKRLTLLGLDPTAYTLGLHILQGAPIGELTLCVQKDVLDAYRNTPGWDAIGKYEGLCSAFAQDGIYYRLLPGYTDVEVAPFSEDGDSYTGDVVIPNRITYQGVSLKVSAIGEYAFYKSAGLTSVKIPSSVTQISWYAFMECTGLTSVTIPNSVKVIYEAVFIYCDNLTTVSVGKGVETIWCGAFSYCPKLESVTLWSSQSYAIYDAAFDSCPSLKSIKLMTPDPSLISLGAHNIFNDTPIDQATLYVPKGCVNTYRQAPLWGSFLNIKENGSEGAYDFQAANDLGTPIYYRYNDGPDGSSVSVTYRSKTEQSYTGDLVIPATVTLGTKTYDVTAIAPYACYSEYNNYNVTSVTIPNSVTEIGERAFAGVHLKSVTFGNSVTTIGERAFYRTDITELALPASLVEIGDYAFGRSEDLQSIVIPDNVMTIGDGAFYECSFVTDITLGESVEHIGSDAFYYCNEVETFTVNVADPAQITLGANPFYALGNYYLRVWVPQGSRALYKAADTWKDFRRIREIGILGDANNDGEIDALDIEAITNHIYQKYSFYAFYEEEADVNGDGVIDALDIAAIIARLQPEE